MPKKQEDSNGSEMKPKRKYRGHGEGTIYQRQDGRWTASIEIEGEGKRKRKYFYGKTKKEVQGKINTALYEQKQGTLVTGAQLTVKRYMEYWLEVIQKPTLRVGSYVSYQSLVKNHVLPTLGHLQLQKLTADHLRSLYAQKRKEGLSATSVKTIHAILHKALEDAVRSNRVNRNVCDSVSPPRSSKGEHQILTQEQAQKLLETAKGHRIEALLTLALATGMRKGEMLSLRWQDIDFENKSLAIRRTVSFYTGHGYVENEPKTMKSRRRVTLPLLVIEVLKQHRVQQDEIRKQAGSEWHNRDLVFPNTLGDYQEVKHLRLLFNKLLKDAGLSYMRFHDLRHSAATILLSMGIHPKVVQELLGHSTISMTMDTYSHVIPSMQQEAMDKWNDLFKDSKGNGNNEDEGKDKNRPSE